MVTRRLARCFLLAAALVLAVEAAPIPKANERPRTLKRSDAKRWQRLKDGAKAEIKVATQKFLQEREQRLTLPLEVDVMLIGLEGDGAYHYRLDASELDELLSAQYVGRDLCPTIWESGQQSAVCASVSTVDLPVHDQNQALDSVELVLRNNMKRIGLQPPYPGAPAESGIPLYEIDAVHVEGEIHNLVAQAYNAEGFGTQTNEDGTHKDPLEHRLAVVVINPSKHRMNPNVTPAQGMNDWHDMDLLQEWKEGRINSSRVRAADAGYAYRYSYNGKGAAQAWVSSFNFVLLDLSAGPAEFGPLTSLGGVTAPSGVPRLEPMMEALAMEVEDAHQFTLHESLVHDAIDAHHRILLGQLASSIASAIDHLMAPDIARKRLEVATTLLVSLVVLQDHDDFNLLDHQNTQIPGVEQEIDTTAIQEAMEQLMPKETQCVMMPSESRLHHMPEVLMALSRARTSWSDAVMLDNPYAGLHRAQHTKIDSRMLMQELKQFVPTFTSNPWVEDSMAKRPNASLASSVYHSGMRHLPVVVLSLKSAPAGMMFENGELVAADHEMVVVLQLLQANTGKEQEAKAASVKLLPKPAYITAEQEEATERLRLYSGHQQDGRPLEMDGARDLTAHIVGGLAMSLGGLVAPWERADSERPDRTQQDWRWAVGCVPWGPYANCTRVSGLIQAAARRNQVMSHIETALVLVQGRLDDIDRLVGEVYEGPWPELIGQMVPHSLNETRQESQRHRHWLDVLHSRSKGHKGPLSPGLILNLENELAGVEMYIASLAWVLWSQTWEMAREQVTGLLNAADEFVAHADVDLNMCRQVASCCTVHHGRPMLMDTFLIVTFLFFLIVFAMIAFIAMASQKVYKPTKRPSSSSGGMFPSNNTYGGQSQGYGAAPWSGGGSGGFAPPYGSGGGSGAYPPPYAAGGMGGSGSFQAPWAGAGSSGSMPRAGVNVPGSRSGSLIPQWGGSGNQGGNTLLPR